MAMVREELVKEKKWAGIGQKNFFKASTSYLNFSQDIHSKSVNQYKPLNAMQIEQTKKAKKALKMNNLILYKQDMDWKCWIERI